MLHRIINVRPLSLLFGLFMSVFASCNRPDEGKATQTEIFKVVSPVVIDTTYQEEYVAEIHALQNVEIRNRVKGFIDQIHVDEGRAVKAGQLLFTLSSRIFREDLLKANAQYKSAAAEYKAVEVELKNTGMLVQKGIVSKTELEMVQAKKEAMQAKMEEANAAISLAKLNLTFTEIRAPFNGVINRIPNKRGSLVEEGTLLTTISNNQEVFAYFHFSESDYLNYVSAGRQDHFRIVDLKLANNSLYNYKGSIEISESEFDPSSGNIAFRARFPNPDALLKHGANGKVIITKPLRSAILIPQRSTFEIQDKVFVYVVNEKNVVKQKSIVPKMRIPHFFVVENGVAPQEKIVYEGVENLKDGQVIKIQPLKAADVLAAAQNAKN